MPSFASFLVSALLVGAGLASALPPKIGTTVNERGSFEVKQVRNPHHKPSGPVSVYKTYLKFGVPIPEELRATVFNITNGRIGKRASGSAPATPIDSFDDAYITPVSIGTPPQVLNLDFDSGSSDLWVFSTQLPASEVNGQTLYNAGASSSSSLKSGYSWSISYGDGSSSSGNVYADKVAVGPLTVTSQAVEAAKTVSSSFTADPDIDGLLGLGFDNINTVSPTKQKTWFTNVKPQLTSPLFTADLKHQAPGTYTFGAIDTSKYTGTITYTSVSTSQGYWTFTSSGYAVGTAAFVSTSISGIADTGTTLLYLPTTIVRAYYNKVSGSSNSNTYGGYIFPCSATLPTFTFGIGSARIVIPAAYLNYGQVTDGSSTCFGGLQSSSGIGINIFGDVALKAAFVVFNGATTPTLGWATKPL
ncbi:aspartic-type endopeptidase-like protein [Lasiosphaeria ovina]|uniref:Aspartic-type endopeptidase-like protein n=1 Tax=Lasiosphaeria ovina TaxID=92902 RepID=A0AAE0JTJ6_9PEZI|nr:aspartic-type endopeptidase-like protein [Lasiosphaeria ovina]